MPEISLPYRTDWPEMLSVIDYIKGSGVDRATLDARFGAGETLRETLNALEELGLIARDDGSFLRLTGRGERLAYAMTEEERTEVLVESFLDYAPYGVPLVRARDDGRGVIDGPWLERIWQVDMRLGQPRNRVEEARTFFLRLAEVAGLGSFQRGVRGQPSRLELGPGFTGLLNEVEEQVRSRAPRSGGSGLSGEAQSGSHSDEKDPAPSAPAARDGGPPAASGVQVIITVDMTEWELERVERFLDLLAERLPNAGIQVRYPSAGDISQ